MAHSWKIVENLDTAAAFRSMGVKVMSDKGTDTQHGTKWTRWSVCNDGNFSGTETPVGPLIKAVRDGDLATIDPAHPILDFLGVLKIRHQLVDAMHNGTHYRIDIPASTHGAQLVRGDEPHAVLMPPHCKTGDIKLACCLIRLGLPLANIEGSPPQCTLWLATPGYELHGSDPVHARHLVADFRALRQEDHWACPAPVPIPQPSALSPNLPRLAGLMHTLWIRDRLHDYINGRVQNLIITSPFNHRGVLMPENTDNNTIDRCRKFLRIP